MSGSAAEPIQKWVHAGSTEISLGGRTLLMGILNVTPDSFSDGAKFVDPKMALEHVEKMVAEGADLIDIGAESTKPGSEPVDEEEELRRLKPILEVIGKNTKIPISVDTRKANVARKVLDWGAVIINDVSALQDDHEMGTVVAEARAGVILMHKRGTPKTMHQYCYYYDVVEEVGHYLRDRIEAAEVLGITRTQIIIDPGIGFAKNSEQNLCLLNKLDALQDLGLPVLVGVSNKSFIGTVLDKPVGDRLMGTAAAVAMAVLKGAQILRVHEVGQMREVIQMVDAIKYVNCRSTKNINTDYKLLKGVRKV